MKFERPQEAIQEEFVSLVQLVAEPSHLEEIFQFEMKRIKETGASEIERDIQVWNSRWRKEVLEHYLLIGWSFIVRDQEQLVGYFIAQPLMFLDGQTQSLWVEHLQYSSLYGRDSLIELAYKLAREKHLQRVYFPNTLAIQNAVQGYRSEPWQSAILIKTTKT